MVAPNSEEVRYDILIEAKQAIEALKTFNKIVTDNTSKIMNFSDLVLLTSKKWGVSWQYALNVYKQLNAELAKSGKATLFGNTGGKNLFAETEKYLSSLDQAGRLQERVGDSGENMGKKVESGARRGARAIDAMRIALGVLVSMLIFRVLQAVENTFREAINQAMQFEETLYRISNAERQLSMEGVEISFKGLKKGIDDIKKALPIFSKEDIAQLVGGVAVSTKELGLNEEQVLKLSAAYAILNVNSTETETLLQTAAKANNALISPQAKSIGNLGLSFGKAKMEAKALEMGLLEQGDSYDKLTEKQKTLIKYQIILDTAGISNIDTIEELASKIQEAGGDFEALKEFLDSDTASVLDNKAAWKDLQTTLGQVILPFIPTLTWFFQLLNDGLNAGKVLLIEFMAVLGTLGVVMYGVFTGQVTNLIQFTDLVGNSIDALREKLTNQFFKEVPENAPDWFTEKWGKLIKEQAETATDGLNKFGEAVEDFDSEGFSEKIDDILEDAERAREDLAEKLSQKREDLDLEYQRKALDAERDYNRKVEDINRDAERDLAALKDKQRQEDLRAEEDYQNKLWELRMRFLMDLEEALHARDARQVIRLQKQYEIDKEALLRKKGLDDKQREEDQRNEVEDIELRRQQRLEDAKREYAEKLADQRLAKQRELDDLNTWYAREQADLEQSIQRKLETLIRGWIEEQKITEANAAQVYAILLKYFGPGGMTDALYAYMASSLAGAAGRAISFVPAPVGSLNYSLGNPQGTNAFAGGLTAPSSGGRTSTTPKNRKGFAEGGTLVASRPTTVTFGEAGAEMAQFTPLTRIGRDVNKVFGGGAGNGMNGQIVVEVLLSPDLEARVVNASMDGVASVVAKVNRMKT